MLGKTALTITEERALALAVQAIGYLTTGQPALDSFNQVEVEAASDFFFWEKRAARGKANLTAKAALAELYWRINRSSRQRLTGTRQKAKLVEAASILAARLEAVRQSEDVYWREVAREAVREAARIVEEGAR